MSSPSSSRGKCRQISLHEIRYATDSFNEENILGEGGEGIVYHGKIQLGDGDDEITQVAVKQLKSNSQEFDKEINTISMIQHPNIVSLLGYCNESGQKILLYEYMENGSLSDYVKVKKTSISLSWLQRIRICLDAARGLQHLHTETSENPKGIIHRDVKPGNILLGNNFVAKISDFGMFKLSKVDQVQSTMITNLKGTSGYYAPEYIAYHTITRRIDVYAFGVVMFEVLCLKMPWDRGDESYYCTDDEDLGIWARKNVDADIKAEISDESLKEFTGIIGSALKKDPRKRPTINGVVLMLEKVLKCQEREDKAMKRLAAGSEYHTPADPQRGASSGVSKTGEYDNAIVLDIGQDITKAGLSIQYTPMDWLVGSVPEGVPGTYFPLRRGGKVVFYQDAHVDDYCMPRLMLDRGLEYVHGNCWRDMYKAIMQAHCMIYITGWSIYPRVQLVRDDENMKYSSSLGELLKMKSQEGVRVLLLVWDDPLLNHVSAIFVLFKIITIILSMLLLFSSQNVIIFINSEIIYTRTGRNYFTAFESFSKRHSLKFVDRW